MSQYSKLKEKVLQELWISFEIYTKMRWFPLHGMIEKFGILKNKRLLFFHASSGCDNISGFRGKGKSQFFKPGTFPNANETFIKLSSFLVILEEKDFIILKVSLYIFMSNQLQI